MNPNLRTKASSALKSARIKKASHVYHIVTPARPDEVLFEPYHSTAKPVQERLKNYFQKYLPLVRFNAGVARIAVVAGYCVDDIRRTCPGSVEIVQNARYASTNARPCGSRPTSVWTSGGENCPLFAAKW